MKRFSFLILAFTFIISAKIHAQTKFVAVKKTDFEMLLPSYLKEADNINPKAAFQFADKDMSIAGFVLVEQKAELKTAGYNVTSLDEYFAVVTEPFEGEKDKTVPSKRVINGESYIHFELNLSDPKTKTKIFYVIGSAETPDVYLQLFIFCDAKYKKKYQEDFLNTLYSFSAAN